MKKIIYITVSAIFTTLLFQGCNADEGIPYENPRLNILEANYVFDADGGNGKIIVEDPGVALSATTKDSWIQDVKVSGTTVSYVIPAGYQSYAARLGIISIKAGEKYVDVSIAQMAAIMDVRPTSFSFEIEGGNVQVNINTKLERTGNIIDVPWATIEENANGLLLKVAKSDHPFTRMGNLTLKYKRDGAEYSTVLPISQFGNLEYSYMTDNGGEWTMTGLNRDNLEIISRTVKFVEKEKGVSYTVTGLRYDNASKDFEWIFNWDKGGKVGITLASALPIGSYVASNQTRYVYPVASYTRAGTPNLGLVGNSDFTTKTMLYGYLEENDDEIFVLVNKNDSYPSSSTAYIHKGLILRYSTEPNGITTSMGSYTNTSVTEITNPYAFMEIKFSRAK